MGLMSGTSADGVDSALVEVGKNRLRLLAAGFHRYPPSVRREVLAASESGGSADLVCTLNARLGKIFGAAAVGLARKNKIPLRKIDFIGSHGQTIRHLPSQKRGGPSSTLQVGDGAEISRAAGVVVVSDFRTADVAAGGCGAPLAPLAHHVMFSSKRENRIVHNLGGIGNLTWLSAGGGLEEVSGFDAGPANMLLDLCAERFLNKTYDKNGAFALSGRVDGKLLRRCLSHPFFRKNPPKSAGREIFGNDYFNELVERFSDVAPADFMRTLCAATAQTSVGQALRFFRVKGRVRWIACGGGAYNRAVMLELKNRLGAAGETTTSGALGFGEKSVEAVMMAILAHRTIQCLPGNLPRVTGARKHAVLGKISLPGPDF
ncbi:MAG: anhydro-N-acetylmuramic acid kinase [Nitrospinae bacterium]|nr:anhydro-N-acetylmuramic acid kinase [Nitrospinota bacterium]